MPGKVIKSTVGTIKGNTVIIKDLNYTVNGFRIVAEKDGSASGTSHSSSGRPQASSMDGSSGLPVWAWVSIAVGGIVCALGIVMIAHARKRKHESAGVPGPQLYGGPGPDTGPWQPPYRQ